MRKAKIDMGLIVEHPFILKVLKDSVEVSKALVKEERGTKKNARPDAQQYYVWLVYKSLFEICTVFQRMDLVLTEMSCFSISKKNKKAGITRGFYVAYLVENYLIRVGSLRDRLIQLVDTVFFLRNAPDCINEKIVLKNAKVVSSGMDKKIRDVLAYIDKQRDPRNSIIHRESYQSERLRHLETLTMVGKEDVSWDEKISVEELLRYAEREIPNEEKMKYSMFNEGLLTRVRDFLNMVEPHYDHEKGQMLYFTKRWVRDMFQRLAKGLMEDGNPGKAPPPSAAGKA